MTPDFSYIEAAAKSIEDSNQREWKFVQPRRYAPPNGYPNPRHNSALLAVYMEFMKSLKPNKVEVDAILSTWQILKHMVPTFFVGQEFAEALTQTEPPENLMIRDLKWPFDGMSFVLPYKFQLEYFGMWVPFIRLAIQDTGYVPPPLEVKKHFPWAMNFGLSEKAYDERAFIITATAIYGDKPVDYSGSFSDKDSIGTMMSDQRYQDFCVDPVSAREMEIVAATNTVEDMKLLKKVIALSGHLLLALNALPEQIEGPVLLRPERVKRGQVVKQELWSPHFLGRTYRWDRESTSQGGTHASPRMHPRRGHWRHQRHGAGRTETRVIWIKPMIVSAKPKDSNDTKD